MNLERKLLFFLASTMLLTACTQTEHGSKEHIKEITSKIDDARLIDADKSPGDWLSYGRNYSEDRYSTLEQINKDNIKDLGLAWSLIIGTDRGVETTPLVVDGIMYLTGSWSKVWAISATTGKMIWTYDPEVPGYFGQRACCDVVNRGVALYKGKIYLGTLDGRLVALDAATGNPEWSTLTVDTTKPYTITGAPRIIDGKVIIGNGGAELGVRGYISAFDAETGKMAWRFYTVPGDPSKPFESEEMKMAAGTWTGNWWQYGGGGTVWDAMAYDPALKLLYIGTGNGSPWNRQHRSPGGGDNLFLASILAINPDNGKLVWYYQTTPGDTWDFTATQHLVLADLTINGEVRKVIMQAPKNGIFYVLDRVNGKLISAKPYTYLNWATGIDSVTGRPIENDFSRYPNDNTEIFPSAFGAHNWQPMAYNRQTKLMYIPVRDLGMIYGHNAAWKYNQVSGFSSGLGWNTGTGYDPAKPLRKAINAPALSERLTAWDPVQQREVWSYRHKAMWNGGLLTTSAGLVFEGTSDGKFMIFDASDGKVLWEKDLGTGIIASPVTYQVGDTQYVTIAVGWGGAMGKHMKFTEHVYPGTVYTFALNRNTAMPRFAKPATKKLIDLPVTATPEQINHGATMFIQYCAVCHSNIGDGGGHTPDLGYSSEATYKIFNDILLKGLLEGKGMPNFSGRLHDSDVTAIRNYVLAEAKASRK